MVAQLVERLRSCIVIGRALQAVPRELLLRVAGDGLEQGALVATLRHAYLDLRLALLAEPPLVQLELGRIVGHQYHLRNAERRLVGIQAFQDLVDQLMRVCVFDLVDDEPLSTHHATLAHEEHLHRGLELVIGKADHVEVLVALGDDLLLFDRAAHTREPVAQSRRELELEVLRGIAHALVERLDHLVGVAVEEREQIDDEPVVAHMVDLADARSGALLDVEQQTRSTESRVVRVLVVATRADGERAQQQVECLANGVGVTERSEIAHALALRAAHHQRARPLVGEGHREERVALVVDQTDVEPGPMLFDERVLEHERFELVAHLDPLDARRRGHHLRGARGHVRGVLEVVRQPLTE